MVQLGLFGRSIKAKAETRGRKKTTRAKGASGGQDGGDGGVEVKVEVEGEVEQVSLERPRGIGRLGIGRDEPEDKQDAPVNKSLIAKPKVEPSEPEPGVAGELKVVTELDKMAHVEYEDKVEIGLDSAG